MSNWIEADWLNFWKIRSSAAQVGATMNPYLVDPVYFTETKYGNLTTMRQDRNLRDPLIEPTISTSYEVGTEFRVLQNRFWGDFNFYNRDSKNQIININTTPSSGYTTRKVNAGLIRNRGVELTLGGLVVKTKDLNWEVNFNISKNSNSLIDLMDPDKDDESYQIYSINAIEGRPIGVIQGNDWQRDDKGNLILGNQTNASRGEVRPYVDTDATKDLGVAQPDFTGGFSTVLFYKGFSLAASLDFSKGGDLVSWTNLWGMGSGILNESIGLNDRGNPIRDLVSAGGGILLKGVDRDGNPKQGYIDAQYYYQSLYPQVWAPSIYDATYVKLREVSLSYELPKQFLKNIGLGVKAASIGFSAQNPWLIYSGTPNIDPSETSGANNNYVEGGQSIATKSYGVTLNLTF